MSGDVNPVLIAMARESRGLTQGQLSVAISVSPSKVSKYESGTLQVSDDDLAALSSALGYTQEFFQQSTEEYLGFGSMCLFHRKRASAQVSLLRTIQARLNIFRMQAAQLRVDVDIELKRKLHLLDVDEFNGPIGAARELRRLWRMRLGPVGNLVGLLESAGIIVWITELGSDRIDAVSQVVSGQVPVFMMNERSPGDRLRFSLCHELGHIVMHQNGSANMEEEADIFAGEFLMPAKDIKPHLANLTIERAAALKPVWRVSMAAIIKRAFDLGQITERRYRTLFTELSKHGWRTLEPLPVEIEQPTALNDILHVQMSDHGMGITTLSKRAFLTDTGEFKKLFLPSAVHTLRIVV